MNARSTSLAFATALALGCSLVPATQAATPAASAAPRDYGWQAALLTGGSAGGPAKDLERAMVDADFDDRAGGWWGPVQYPVSTGGHGLLLTVRVPRGRNEWSGHVGWNRTGETDGYRTPNDMVDIQHDVRMLALTLGRPVSGRWSVGAGPAIYLVSVSQVVMENATHRTHSVRAGLLLDAGLRWPARSRWYCDLALQGRWLGRVKVGPFTAGVDPEDGAVLPATSPRFDHLFVAIGLGRRQQRPSPRRERLTCRGTRRSRPSRSG
jgi:hypothetical protein